MTGRVIIHINFRPGDVKIQILFQKKNNKPNVFFYFCFDYVITRCRVYDVCVYCVYAHCSSCVFFHIIYLRHSFHFLQLLPRSQKKCIFSSVKKHNSKLKQQVAHPTIIIIFVHCVSVKTVTKIILLDSTIFYSSEWTWLFIIRFHLMFIY